MLFYPWELLTLHFSWRYKITKFVTKSFYIYYTIRNVHRLCQFTEYIADSRILFVKMSAIDGQ